jgi:hypothetical protein
MLSAGPSTGFGSFVAIDLVLVEAERLRSDARRILRAGAL